MNFQKKRHLGGGASANRLGGLDYAEANSTLAAMRRQAEMQCILLQRALVLVRDSAQIGKQMQHVLKGGAA